MPCVRTMADKADDVPHVVRDPSTGRALSLKDVVKRYHLVCLGKPRQDVYRDPSGKLWFVRSLSDSSKTFR
jgi:hypothetical protein